jgi:TPR repeat protein
MLTSWFATGVPHDPERAADLLSRACDAGITSACADLGTMITDSGKDAARGRALLERGCDAGIGRACFYAANFGGADAKARAALEAKGRKALDAACSESPWECHAAAEQTIDAASAKRKHTTACEWGVTHACAAIGAIFFKPSPRPPSR